MPSSMMRCVLAAGWCLLAGGVNAAAPNVTHLFPAGGQRGKTVQVTAGGTFERWPVQIHVEGKGLTVKPAKVKGKFDVTIAADAEPLHWLRFHDDEGASRLLPFVVDNLPEIIEKEPNDDPRKLTALDSARVTVNGRLGKPGDVDCYALKLAKDAKLVVALEANQTLGSPMDGIVQILSSDGFVLEQNNDFRGLDARLIFDVPKDGSYIVRVFSFPAKPSSSIRFAGGDDYVYRLTLTTGGFVDHAFPLAVPRSTPGKVELVGWNIPAADRQVAVPANSTDESFVFAPKLAGGGAVQLEPHPTALATGTEEQPQTIALPITISGCLKKDNDSQAFAFEARKGESLDIQIEGRGLGFPLMPVLIVSNADGKQISRTESRQPTEDPKVLFRVPADGRYRLAVRELHNAGGPRHLYRLRIVRAEPEFDLTLAADRFTLTPEKPLAIPVIIVRRNGFKSDVELSVEGLPPGVAASTEVKGPPAKAKTLILKLTAPKEIKPGGGTIRIVGSAKDKSGLRRNARFPLAEQHTSTTTVWLQMSRKSVQAK